MIKGLAITPPVLGRISIGRVVEKNGKRLPEKDDQFTITSQIQTPGGWLPHPLDEALRQDAPHHKLRNIPIRLLFSDPDLNFRAEYTLFDRATGRPVCAGNGIQCRRHSEGGMATLPCPSPSHCDVGAGGRCKPFGRLNVRIGDEDTLGTFIFRTTGYNSIRTLMARLAYFEAVSGGLLACLPLELTLRGKSTTQSHRTPIYYVDIGVREGMTLDESIAEAKALHQQRLDNGFNQPALDNAARRGFANGAFEESDTDASDVIEEFYPDEAGNGATEPVGDDTRSGDTASLADKLQQRATSQPHPANVDPADTDQT